MSERRFNSLRARITLAMLALAAVGSSIFAASIYIAAERLEQSVLNRHVLNEFHTLVARAHGEPGFKHVATDLLIGFVGRDHPELPAEFAALTPGGYHGVVVGDQEYQVYVGEDGGRTYYVAYDITEWEALEKPVILTLIAGVVVGTLLAIVLGYWISAQVIAPVTALSERLRTLDPRQRNVRIASQFDGEVSTIAESFDRYMERLDGFVEREQLFTAAAAHELRTPLAVIQGATEVLAEQPGLPPAAERATRRLERAIREMREFIEALLFLSREERREADEHASCEVGRIVRQLAEDYRTLNGHARLSWSLAVSDELRLDVPPALPTIVIGNLLRNAAENTEAGTIEVGLEGRTLKIVDSGPGIPAEALPRLFEAGYSTKSRGGMGLHLAKRICDRFGWRISITSTPGEGTAVMVTF